MAGTKRRRSWQKKIQQLIDEKLARSDFQDELSNLGTGLQITDWVEISSKYNLPLSTYGYISHYLQTGKREPSLISSPVVLITDTDRTIEPTETPELHYQIHETAETKFINHKRGLYLQILDEATISDIENFIRDNAELIAKKMLVTRGRVHTPIRQSRFTKRDDYIYSELSSRKKSTQELAQEYSITPQHVRQIYSRQKKKRDIE